MKTRTASAISLAVLLAFGPGWLQAEVKMPAIFGDHMVLQQDEVLPVWGTAEPGEKITVTLASKTANTIAGADGKWLLKLEPLPETNEALTLTVSGSNTLKFSDVLIGEVWVCSGQSNMSFSLSSAHNAAEEMPKATDEKIRFFKFPQTPKAFPSDEVVGKWEVCSPVTAKNFSAVGYFFGREIRSELKRPVGLIQSAWSGTPAQSWTPLEDLKKEPELKEYAERIDQHLAAFPEANKAYPALQAAYESEKALWQKEVGVAYNPILEGWKKEVAAAKAAGQPLPPQPKPERPQPKAPDNPQGGGSTPTVLYNGMIAPLIPYAIKGVIWYQGESNAGKAAQYRILFASMIKGWRKHWGQGDFPFLFVQLAGFEKRGEGDTWPYLREAQSQTLVLPHTGMATAMDVGAAEEIHPQDKIDVGIRLALVARHVAYGKTLVYSGPVYESMKVEGNSIRLSFTQIGGGLVIGRAPWRHPDSPALPTDKLVGFTIAGEDQKWVEADAKIDGTNLVVSTPLVSNPVAVRYAWANFPQANFYNKENLPALPFRTDSWPQPVFVPAP